jgi:hypothetical protein
VASELGITYAPIWKPPIHSELVPDKTPPPDGSKEGYVMGAIRKWKNAREIRTRTRIDLVRLVLQLGFVSVAAAASILVNRNKVQEDQ